MANRLEKREKLKAEILQTAARLFLVHGIKAVKMDDISNALKISKRTLYEVYENKHDLLLDVLLLLEDRLRNEIDTYSKTCENVMDQLIGFFNIRIKVYSGANPQFYSDIAKYPELLERLKQHNEKFHHDAEEFFRRGVEEGYFLETVNYKLLTMLCSNCMENVKSNSEFKNFGIADLFYSFTCVIIRGFCTQKGLEQLDRFIEDIRKKGVLK